MLAECSASLAEHFGSSFGSGCFLPTMGDFDEEADKARLFISSSTFDGTKGPYATASVPLRYVFEQYLKVPENLQVVAEYFLKHNPSGTGEPGYYQNWDWADQSNSRVDREKRGECVFSVTMEAFECAGSHWRSNWDLHYANAKESGKLWRQSVRTYRAEQLEDLRLSPIVVRYGELDLSITLVERFFLADYAANYDITSHTTQKSHTDIATNTTDRRVTQQLTTTGKLATFDGAVNISEADHDDADGATRLHVLKDSFGGVEYSKMFQEPFHSMSRILFGIISDLATYILLYTSGSIAKVEARFKLTGRLSLTLRVDKFTGRVKAFHKSGEVFFAAMRNEDCAHLRDAFSAEMRFPGEPERGLAMQMPASNDNIDFVSFFTRLNRFRVRFVGWVEF